MALTPKQQAFADAYLANGMNATQAAIEAGYSKRTAESQGSRLLRNVKVRDHIKERMDALTEARIVTGNEVLAFLSDVMCGNLEETCVMPCEGGVMEKGYVSQRNQIKAAELLGKAHGLFTQGVRHEGEVGVTFVNDLPEDDG